MVERRYMLDKPAAPSAVARFIGQCAMPAAIDAAASMEAMLEKAAVATRANPLPALALALSLGGLLALLTWRRRPAA